MNELELQEKYLINFFCERNDGLNYKEVKANTVSSNFFILDDLKNFISQTKLNQENYKKLVKKFDSEKEFIQKFSEFLDDRIKSSTNMALFINNNQSVTFEGYKIYLFYPSGSETFEDSLFEENIFSVVQELPFTFTFENKKRFSFRPDITIFLNGIYLGYSELKSNYNAQNARNHGRKKVANDYLEAVKEYLKIVEKNDLSQTIRKDFLKIFEKAIHITATDINETYVIRNISSFFEEIRNNIESITYSPETHILKDFKPYPIKNKEALKTERFEEVLKALYDKKMIEKEILYYNFIERDLIQKEKSKTKEYKHSNGRLISPRPKQKFGTDKILSKVIEFLEHENEPDYFIKKLEKQLREKGLGENQIKDLLAKRSKYKNNKNVYSLLLQYAAGFGKSNIIGWTALQLKDFRINGKYVYDKIILVVDRIQLRDQLDSMLHNMNIQRSLFIEASDSKSFKNALESDKRIVVVNIQKFTSISSVIDQSVVEKLAKLRIVFIIDEIHRSNSGIQHEEMISVFDELQGSIDQNIENIPIQKKNLIIGFTATPTDHTLARFGEYNKYAESEKIWVPFDSYTMKEAIEDGFIINPLNGLIPVSAKMYFEVPINEIEGFEGDIGYEEVPDNTSTGIDEYGRKYKIRKKRIYSNPERIEAISKFIVERLLNNVYNNIKGTAKAMFAVSSIKNAISYKKIITKLYKEMVNQKKYERFKDAPVYIVYSESQENENSNQYNEGLSEKQVIQNFKIAKNGIIIVVDKLQTGFDEPKLHTLFLDKEIIGINAIQTISRVNRKTKNKHDCKIVDFSYKNVNINNIRQAFEHYSNVIVTDFNPIEEERKIDIYFNELKQNILYLDHFQDFDLYEGEYSFILSLTNSFEKYIRNKEPEAKRLKKQILNYFKLLSLIEYVIDIEKKYVEPTFLNFWKIYNREYNNINQQDEIIDDVEIYFDNKIGLVEPKSFKNKEKRKKVIAETVEIDEVSDGSNFKYNILKVIEKRNQEEQLIEEMINEFIQKVELFFEFINNNEDGKRLIAKIKDFNNSFSQDEIFKDFNVMYRKFTIVNSNLGDFFLRETKDNLKQLCDDFEIKVKSQKI